MEKKKNSAKNNGPSSTSTNSKTFGSNKVEENATWLIGSIIEKGIKENPQIKPLTPPSAPNPSVLPFPVARHRSYRPYWAPIESKKRDNDEEANDKDDDDGEYPKVFANPIQKKEKKGVNVSRWRELLPTEDASMISKERKDKLLMESKEQKKYEERTEMKSTSTKMEVDPQLVSHILIARTTEDPTTGIQESVDQMDIDNLDKLSSEWNIMCANSDSNGEPVSRILYGKRDDSIKLQAETTERPNFSLLEMNKMREERTSVSKSSHSGNMYQSMTLESEIDSENRARLEGMTPAEIAEAQSEIMEKMKPGLLEVLKRRGQNKLKKKNYSQSDLVTNAEQDNLQDKVQDTKMTTVLQGGNSQDAQSRLNDHFVQSLGPDASSSWNAWSDRVEAVRNVRFSLDGNVIEDNTAQEPGENLIQSDYNADNVAERDFLRTEGDPGAAGYTIKEALALTRSVVPGQRALALHLLASVLHNALQNIHRSQVGHPVSMANINKFTDWEAVWAFALGPEPELILSLRMSLDDNHNSVVLACAKVILCILSCDENEIFFEMSEKTGIHQKGIYTAPIFRSKPEVDGGFLPGGFWKYNAKPSNIFPYGEDFIHETTEEEHTIQDDVFIAGQDIAAGLVRMGILPRICYLLETDHSVTLEECLISILVAFARHSPVSASAIMKCPRLVQTVVNGFTLQDGMKIQSSKIKSITLLKVLAQSDRKNCMEFVKNGTFRTMTWQLYQYILSIDQWMKLGKDHCKLASALMVEQLRFWKVSIQYGYCVSDFEDIFPALCLWLNPPSFGKLFKDDLFNEVACISMEAYLVLEALARRLPKFYSQTNLANEVTEIHGDGTEAWYWRHVGPMVDLALKWLRVTSDPDISKFFDRKEGNKPDYVLQDFSLSPLLWVISGVLHMLSTVLERVIPEDIISLSGSDGVVPWLPEFVPKIGLEIIKNNYLTFLNSKVTECDSLVGDFCYFRHENDCQISLASVCCLHGLVHVVVSIDALIQSAKTKTHTSIEHSSSNEGKILEDGMIKWSVVELRNVQATFMKEVDLGWHRMQLIEKFGRGGPAPGVGLGWGASGGGFWSKKMLLLQTDARLLIRLLQISVSWPVKEPGAFKEMTNTLQTINSTLEICSTLGPRDRGIMEVTLAILLQVPALKCLNYFVRRFIDFNGVKKTFRWEYEEEDYDLFSKVLASHFSTTWLSVKKKSKALGSDSSRHTKSKNVGGSLDTIFEGSDTSLVTTEYESHSSLLIEWAHQRLPLPMHWFLSPISTINIGKHTDLQNVAKMSTLLQNPKEFLEVAKSGLFFLLGLEAMIPFLPGVGHSPVQTVPLVWKLHSLSVVLLDGMGVLEDEKSRDVYDALQELYGLQLNKPCFPIGNDVILDKNETIMVGKKHNMESLKFQSEIHESYTTFIETLVEQFAALSYGDLIYGRQITIYLHRHVESPVRLAAWNALSNACVLELLPHLEKCFAQAEGYLEPVEDDERILEAYVKSWVSGALDRAATRRSLAFILALHHLSSFIFQPYANDKLFLQNKLAKSLLRDYSRKRQHEGMMLELIQYNNPLASQNVGKEEDPPLQSSRIEERFKVLVEACEGNSTLLREVEKLKSLTVKDQYVVI